MLLDWRAGADGFGKHVFCVLELSTVQLHAWGANLRGADACLLLHPLDELHERGHGIHAKQGQESFVELEGGLICVCQLEERYGLGRVGIDQSGDPAGGPSGYAFDQDVIHTDANVELIAQDLANGCYAADVGALFLNGGQVGVLGCKLRNLGGKKAVGAGDALICKGLADLRRWLRGAMMVNLP